MQKIFLLILVLLITYTGYTQTAIDYVTNGESKYHLKDYYGSIADYTKAIELNPEYAVAYFNRGVSKTDLKDYYGSIADYTKAININPEYAEAYFNRAVSKDNLKDFYGSIGDYSWLFIISDN